MKRNLLSIQDLTREEILHLLSTAKELSERPEPNLLSGKLLGSCFFEPSTRTRISFEAAMHRLGGQVVGFADAGVSATAKGETLHDSMRIMGQYVDAIVVRHPLEGSAKVAAEATDVPVINAGDGANQHPTQTLLDLYAIQECQGRLDDLQIAMVGDLRYGRTVHSLAKACCHFNSRLYFVSPPRLEMPDPLCDELRQQGLRFSFHEDLEEVIDKVDILYMTRIQKERFKHEGERGPYDLPLDRAKESMRILHPLPRCEELPVEVDDTPFAYYFEQAAGGLLVRQALLSFLLGAEVMA
jgi:aspartate carbamoyltransferase catalytic subunit